MAVTQISQIQVRYGLQADIGNLAAGEFAWAIDTQRLFIGNGTPEEGAPIAGITEIMTSTIDFSELFVNYTFKGYQGGYEAITGPDDTFPIVRSFQDKIDDIVNSRDFGTSGTGNVDDTAALQRALDEIYNRQQPTTAQRTRRTIKIPAGTYRIEGSLRIPPYVTLVGDGMDNVRIRFVNGGNITLTTTTGTDPVVLSTLPKYPYSVNIKGMTFETVQETAIFKIDGSRDIVFEDIAFVGPTANPNISNSGSCVEIKSSVVETTGIYFNRCTFRNMKYAVVASAETQTYNIVFDNCRFTRLYQGIYTTSVTSGIKISNSVFDGIYSNAINGSNGAYGIISMGNTFRDVGAHYGGDDTEDPLWEPIIVFTADNNYSLADIFVRSFESSLVYPRIRAHGVSTVSLSLDDYFRIGSSSTTPGYRISIPSGNDGTKDLVGINNGLITYRATRGPDVRTGTIKFSSLENDDDIGYDDECVETNDIGLDLSVTKLSGVVSVKWATTDNAIPTILKFDVKTFN